MTLVELEKLKEELADDSKQIRDVFNENLQNTFAESLIRRLKIEPQISKKVFAPLVMQIPFNPFTGISGDDYNLAKKWVTAKSPSAVMQVLKQHCNENPDVKELYQQAARYSGNWDTSDFTIVDSPADKAILWGYRRPMAYTFPIVSISNPQLTGSEWSQNYLLPTEQDPQTGAFTGTLGFTHLVASLLGSLASREVASFKEALRNKNPNNLSKSMGRPFTATDSYLEISEDSLDAKERRREIRKYYGMTPPYSAIVVPLLAFDLTPRSGKIFKHDEVTDEYVLLDHFKNYGNIDIEKYLYYNSSMGLREELDNIVGNLYPRNPSKFKDRNNEKDLYPNWVLLDYVLNDTRSVLTTEEKFALSQRLKFSQEGESLFDPITKQWRAPEVEHFIESLSKFFDMAYDKDFIRTIRGWMSSEFKQPNEALEDALTNFIRSYFPPTLAIYDDSIRVKYGDLLIQLFPEEHAAFTANNVDMIAAEGEQLMNELLEEGTKTEGQILDDSEEDDEEDLIIDIELPTIV